MLFNPARKGQNLKSLFAHVVYQIRCARAVQKPKQTHLVIFLAILLTSSIQVCT